MNNVKVIMSCNENPYYLDFWPLVSKVWKERIGITPVLVFVGDDKQEIDETFGEVVKINPIEGVPIHTQAQFARLWYPIKEPDTLWVTSDIDMFPVSKSYWKENTLPGDFDWKNLNTNLQNYFPCCYNIATGKNFKEVLSVNDDFGEFLEYVMSNFKGTLSITPVPNGELCEQWDLDEIYSSEMVCRWRDKHGRVEQPLRPGGYHSGRRIDRAGWHYEQEGIRVDYYIDCHSLRPYHDHKNTIDELMEHLLS